MAKHFGSRVAMSTALALAMLAACQVAPPAADVAPEQSEREPPPLETEGEDSGAPLMRPPRELVDDGAFYVLTDAPESPRVRYVDGQVSKNSSCAIRRGNKLSRRVPPVYVNGEPIGFC